VTRAKVSVLLPTYNRAGFIAESLKSIFAQTLPPSQVIVVNDGSTDHTLTALEPFRQQIEYVESENRGKPSALNLGMAQDFSIETPLMRLTKADTWALAKRLGGEALVEVVVEDSHTCYLGDRDTRHPWGYGCGTCPACELRAGGWEGWLAQGRPALAA